MGCVFPNTLYQRPSIRKKMNKFFSFLTEIMKLLKCTVLINPLTTNVPSYRNQSVDLICKLTGWFIYDEIIGH